MVQPSPKPKLIMVDALVGNEYSTCLCQALSRTNINVDLVVTKDRADVENPGFSFLKWMPSKKSNSGKYKKTITYITYIVKIFSYIIKNKPNVIHYQFFRIHRLESIIYVLLTFLNIKKVYTAHNVIPHEYNNFDYFLSKIVYKNSDILIAHSDYIKNKIIDKFNIIPQKIHVIPHGNFDYYLPKEKLSKHEIRKKMVTMIQISYFYFLDI